jgi:prenyltransferase beta subunit
MVDPFHTLFGVAALSMLDFPSPSALAPVNSIFCMTSAVLPKHLAAI